MFKLQRGKDMILLSARSLLAGPTITQCQCLVGNILGLQIQLLRAILNHTKKVQKYDKFRICILVVTC